MAMSRWRAAWLNWRAVRFDAGRATARLAARASRGDQNAVDALWYVWFARPDEATLRVLVDGGRPISGGPSLDFSRVVLGDESADRSYVLLLARQFERPVHDHARRYVVESGDQELVDDFCRDVVHADPADPRLAAFCAAHDLAPSDPVARAGFLFLTGQRARYEEADPDGRLLAEFYPSGSHPIGTRVRERLLAAPELPALRLLSDPAAGHLAMADEVQDMAAGLLGVGRHDEAWALLLDGPVEDLLRALPSVPADWRPSDPADRVLLTRLRDLAPHGDLPEVSVLAHEADWPDDAPPVWLTLVDRPMALLGREHLDAARTELAGDLPDPVRRLLAALEACLDRRSGAP